MMIACDVCDNWYHPGCLPAAHVPAGDDSFVCPFCVDAKADVYISDGLGSALADELLSSKIGGLSDVDFGSD